MSFSGKVKEELAGNISPARHCRIAELAAFIGMCGTVQHKNPYRKFTCGKKSLYIDPKNL